MDTQLIQLSVINVCCTQLRSVHRSVHHVLKHMRQAGRGLFRSKFGLAAIIEEGNGRNRRPKL